MGTRVCITARTTCASGPSRAGTSGRRLCFHARTRARACAHAHAETTMLVWSSNHPSLTNVSRVANLDTGAHTLIMHAHMHAQNCMLTRASKETPHLSRTLTPAASTAWKSCTADSWTTRSARTGSSPGPRPTRAKSGGGRPQTRGPRPEPKEPKKERNGSREILYVLCALNC